jgi:hypothetical protein
VTPEHQCRYLRRNDERCTAEVADPDGEILLCTKHLAYAMQLLTRVRRSKST